MVSREGGGIDLRLPDVDGTQDGLEHALAYKGIESGEFKL